jgi:hypothetical protein
MRLVEDIEELTGREGIAAALVVALLTVPQVTHYVLDRWIWRVGPDNQRLAEQLGFGRPRTGTPD